LRQRLQHEWGRQGCMATVIRVPAKTPRFCWLLSSNSPVLYRQPSPPACCHFPPSRQQVRVSFWVRPTFHQGFRPCSGHFTAPHNGLTASRRVFTPSRRRFTCTVIVTEKARIVSEKALFASEKARTVTEKARMGSERAVFVTVKAVGAGEKAWTVDETICIDH